MSYEALVYNVMIASPSDVNEERRTIREAIFEWNYKNYLPLKKGYIISVSSYIEISKTNEIIENITRKGNIKNDLTA